MKYIKTTLGVFPVSEFVEFFDVEKKRKSFRCDVIECQGPGSISFLIFWEQDILSFISETEYNKIKFPNLQCKSGKNSFFVSLPAPTYEGRGVFDENTATKKKEGIGDAFSYAVNKGTQLNEFKALKQIATLSTIEKQAKAIMFQCHCQKAEGYKGLSACVEYASSIGLTITRDQFKRIRDLSKIKKGLKRN